MIQNGRRPTSRKRTCGAPMATGKSSCPALLQPKTGVNRVVSRPTPSRRLNVSNLSPMRSKRRIDLLVITPCCIRRPYAGLSTKVSSLCRRVLAIGGITVRMIFRLACCSDCYFSARNNHVQLWPIAKSDDSITSSSSSCLRAFVSSTIFLLLNLILNCCRRPPSRQSSLD